MSAKNSSLSSSSISASRARTCVYNSFPFIFLGMFGIFLFGQSLDRCPIVLQLKHAPFFMRAVLSSVDMESTSMAFRSFWNLAKVEIDPFSFVFLFLLEVVLPPRFCFFDIALFMCKKLFCSLIAHLYQPSRSVGGVERDMMFRWRGMGREKSFPEVFHYCIILCVFQFGDLHLELGDMFFNGCIAHLEFLHFIDGIYRGIVWGEVLDDEIN